MQKMKLNAQLSENKVVVESCINIKIVRYKSGIPPRARAIKSIIFEIRTFEDVCFSESTEGNGICAKR
jgi:hypothetical protein